MRRAISLLPRPRRRPTQCFVCEPPTSTLAVAWWALIGLLAGALLVAMAMASEAGEPALLPPGTPAPVYASPSSPALSPAYVRPVAVKRWFYLPKQRAWGYGYRRYDGLIVVDPGTKRPAAGRAQAPR